MKTIKAKDVTVGMMLAGGEVVEAATEFGVVGITYKVHDYDCGEDEYFPCEYQPDDIIQII